MQIQNHSQTNLLHLQRQILDSGPLAPGPLGTIGNLQFKPVYGGTPRASSPGLWARVGHFLSELKFAVSLASWKARAQHREANQILANSRHMGNLLGSLTATYKHPQASTRAAQYLVAISKSSQGNLANLPRGQASLSAYMSQLTSTDLWSLKDGILYNSYHCSELLREISPGLRAQAAGVLEQIREAVDREFIREPLLRMAVLLSASAVDMEELRVLLMAVPKDASKLDDCFKSLSKDQSDALLAALRPEKLDIVEQAVLLESPDSGFGHSFYRPRLENLRELVAREAQARSQAASAAEPAVIYTRDLHLQVR